MLVLTMILGGTAVACETSTDHISGAIFTTDINGGVNINLFSDRQAVYLDGGPKNVGTAALTPGNYYVQVTDPNGKLLGSSYSDTPVTVDVYGKFIEKVNLWNILYIPPNKTQHGYKATTNYGGEYKVWISKDLKFRNYNTKTDNFKVKENILNNNLPTVPNYTMTTNAGIALSGRVVGTDSDGDTLTYAKKIGPSHGTVVVNADGNYTYTPIKCYTGLDSFTVTVSDGKCGTATSTVSITVNAGTANHAPTVLNYTMTTNAGMALSGSVVGNDSDGDSLTYAMGIGPAHGTLVVNADGTYTYTPTTDYTGSDSFTVTVSDGKGGNATSTVNINVNAVNHAPTVEDYPEETTNAGTPLNGNVVGTDSDGDSLTYAIGNAPTNGTVVVNADGTYTYTPNDGYIGLDSFTVTVSDGKGGTATSTVNITIFNPEVD